MRYAKSGFWISDLEGSGPDQR